MNYLDPKFNAKTDGRDVFYQADVDEGCSKIAELLGWKEELDKLVENDMKQHNNAVPAEIPTQKL